MAGASAGSHGLGRGRWPLAGGSGGRLGVGSAASPSPAV